MNLYTRFRLVPKLMTLDAGASTPLKHGRSLRPRKNEGGTKIMHIFVKIGGEIKGRGEKD